MSDLRSSELKQPVDVAEYLFLRLHQVGVRDVHGVPGDYNLVALDYIAKNGLRWVGNVNELNAGYAADGYARVAGIGAVMTTFGVGELSALNAVAGAYSEYVPIVHIVGCPSTASQKNGMLLHHTLGNGDFNVFSNMSREISCAVSLLDDANEASLLIDNAIRECFMKSRPVYIRLPTDIVQKKVEGERLQTPLDLKYPGNDEEKEEYVVNVVLKYINEAKNPMILVDACAIRHRALREVTDFVVKSNFPVFVAPMGKGAVDETLPNFGGVYAGNGSNPGVAEQIESSDLVLSIGAIKSDFNTAGFTYRISQLSTIDFHSTFIRVKYSEYPDIRMEGVLKKVTERMTRVASPPAPRPKNQLPESEANSQKQVITHSWLWPQIGEFLECDDIVITETGTSSFGIWETTFPKGVTCISQVLWGSIGYATAACQGAALAAKQLGERRTILFTGDGSFQLSAQELSTMIRRNLNPIIFIICNEGYTIERYIHGWEEEYNDIQPWRHGDLCRVFGASPEQAKSYTIRQRSELTELFADKNFRDAPYLRLVELSMPRDDAPRSMQMTAESSARQNQK